MKELLPKKYAPHQVFRICCVAYEQKCWLPEKFREKKLYLPGKELSVFLALKAEDSLSEKYVRIKIAYVNIDFYWVAYAN